MLHFYDGSSSWEAWSSGGTFQEKIALNEPEQSSDSICQQENVWLL